MLVFYDADVKFTYCSEAVWSLGVVASDLNDQGNSDRWRSICLNDVDCSLHVK